MVAAVTDTLPVSVKAVLVFVTAVCLVGLGIPLHTLTQEFMFISPMRQSVSCTLVSKATRKPERMGDHTREVYMVQSWW